MQIVSSGTICTNSLQIRDTFKNSDSNNWVFTQSVSYLDAIEVIVNATIRFRGCHQRSSLTPPCRNNFVTLHRYDTNSTRPLNEINNTVNYEPCFGDAMSSRLEDSSGNINAISVIKRFVRPNFKMTYFGIQDNGSYGDVQRILVYYRVAQGYEEGLVRCPTIALPREGSSDTVSKSCTCKENAIPRNNMQLTCRANGVCQGSPMCQCKAGYQGQSDCQGMVSMIDNYLAIRGLVLITAVYYSSTSLEHNSDTNLGAQCKPTFSANNEYLCANILLRCLTMSVMLIRTTMSIEFTDHTFRTC